MIFAVRGTIGRPRDTVTTCQLEIILLVDETHVSDESDADRGMRRGCSVVVMERQR
jgi:hypothetical protein